MSCVCLPLCCICVCSVWHLGTVTAWRWWTTCRKPSCCVCQHWICMEAPILTSALPVPPAGTDSPPQVAHAHISGIRPHTHAWTQLTQFASTQWCQWCHLYIQTLQPSHLFLTLLSFIFLPSLSFFFCLLCIFSPRFRLIDQTQLSFMNSMESMFKWFDLCDQYH